MQDDKQNQTPGLKKPAQSGNGLIIISSRKRQAWVNVAMFDNVSDGQMLEKDLRNKGFEARTYNDKLLQYFLFLCPPHATIRVQVRQLLLEHEPF